MKTRLTLTLALLLICTGAALAQTPDWQTPSQETVCDVESGAAFGLCNAYCEAMDCESENPQASATACTKVKDKFTQITGHDLPCEAVACPCSGLPEWEAVLAGTVISCTSSESFATVNLLTTTGFIAATEDEFQPLGGGCGVFSVIPSIILSITPEQGAACVEVLRAACDGGGPAG